MPDQNNALWAGEPPGSARPPLLSLTVPAVIVGDLRDGAYAALGLAASEIDCAVCSGDRDAHPERCISEFERLDAVRSLLEALGWSAPVPPVDVRLELSRNEGAFATVLDTALMFAEDDLREVQRRNAELTARGDAPQRNVTVEHVDALCDFAASARHLIGMPGAEEETAK